MKEIAFSGCAVAMKNITDPADIETIVVFRALNLGDMLCAVPALRAIRAWRPDARISYVGLPWARTFFSRFRRYLDEFIEFPGYPGLPELEPDIRGLPEFLRRMQERRFDLALQMHGNGTLTASVVGLFGASVTAGFCAEGAYFPPDGWPLPYPEELPETERCLKLAEALLGTPARDSALEFPLNEQDFAELKEIPEASCLERGGYIVLHPGANARVRRWLPEGFAEVGDSLSEGRRPVIITGSASERDTAERVRLRMKHPAVNLAGRTTLGALGALVKDALLVIANDTGISHIAAALKVPSVIVVTASDPRRWNSGSAGPRRTIVHPMPCRPCAFPVCPIGHPCAREIKSAEVTAKARELLEAGKTAVIL